MLTRWRNNRPRNEPASCERTRQLLRELGHDDRLGRVWGFSDGEGGEHITSEQMRDTATKLQAIIDTAGPHANGSWPDERR